MQYLKGSTIALMLVCAVLPVAAWVEQQEPTMWTKSLIAPFLDPEPNRHTPQHSQGTFLPPLIAKDTTLTPSHNPVLLTTSTRIAPGATLTLAPGTTVFAHEFAQLIVEGTLRIAGESTAPVTFTTNELHPTNRTWSGILFAPGSAGTIQHATIRYGSPALSCLSNSSVSMNAINIMTGSAGLFTSSKKCTVSNSVISDVRDGIIALNVAIESQITNTDISARNQQIATPGTPLPHD
jgi:hypothetical protein